MLPLSFSNQEIPVFDQFRLKRVEISNSTKATTLVLNFLVGKLLQPSMFKKLGRCSYYLQEVGVPSAGVCSAIEGRLI
jgi:hypothetical protein